MGNGSLHRVKGSVCGIDPASKAHVAESSEMYHLYTGSGTLRTLGGSILHSFAFTSRKYMYCCCIVTELHHYTIRLDIHPAVELLFVYKSFAALR